LNRSPILVALLAAALASSVLGASDAQAATNEHEIFSSLVNAKVSGSGNPLNGVSARLYVASGLNASISGTYSEIYMTDRTGYQYVQLGSFQGQRTQSSSDCSSYGTYSYPQPHLMLIYRRKSDGCEHTQDLGQFGSSGNYRNFGLRRNPDGSYYATLDNVTKTTTPASFDTALYPAAAAESHDSCADLYLDAQDTTISGGASLGLHDDVQGWRYWTGSVGWVDGLQSPENSGQLQYGYPNGYTNTAHIAGPYPAC
jgi:hypothetical protein